MNSRPNLQTDSHLAAALAEIMKSHGNSILDDPDRLTSSLRDYSGGQGRGVFVLITALNEGVPQRLIAAGRRNVPPEVFRANLVRTLQTRRGIDAEQSVWAVDTWAAAIGLPVLQTNLPEIPVTTPEPERALDFAANPQIKAIRISDGSRLCPFCGSPGNAQHCISCRRDTTAPRRICRKCGKMAPMTDGRCWNCGKGFRSDLWWIVPLIVILFIAAIVLGVVAQNS